MLKIHRRFDTSWLKFREEAYCRVDITDRKWVIKAGQPGGSDEPNWNTSQTVRAGLLSVALRKLRSGVRAWALVAGRDSYPLRINGGVVAPGDVQRFFIAYWPRFTQNASAMCDSVAGVSFR